MSKYTQEQVIEKFKIAHPEGKYDYSKVKYEGSKKLVIIFCLIHNLLFNQRPEKHWLGQTGCKPCAKEKSRLALAKTTKEFIRDAEEVHGDFYDYHLVNYITGRIKVTIICPHHDKFDMAPDHHLQGEKCPNCSKEESARKRTKPERIFIQQATEKHHGFYTYENVKYLGDKINVLITCKKHGGYWQTPSHHLQGEKCPNCSKEESARKRAKPQDVFIQQVTEKHNGIYDYSLVEYKNNRTHVKIICPIHGIFNQSPRKHLLGRGCQDCPLEGKYKKEGMCRNFFEEYFSKPFNKIRPNWLKNPQTKCNLELDGYNEELKIAFEYNGEQHYIFHEIFHKSVEDLENQQLKDEFKKQKCLELGIRLIIIPCWIEEHQLRIYILQHFKPFNLKIDENNSISVCRR